jgi:hypothetical protein
MASGESTAGLEDESPQAMSPVTITARKKVRIVDVMIRHMS